MAISAQDGDVKQDVSHSVIGNDEPIAFCGVKPLNGAGDLNDIRRSVFDGFIESCEIVYEWRAVAPHAANPRCISSAFLALKADRSSARRVYSGAKIPFERSEASTKFRWNFSLLIVISMQFRIFVSEAYDSPNELEIMALTNMIGEN
jgi:hypothetical protein